MTTQRPIVSGAAMFGLILMIAGALTLGWTYYAGQNEPSALDIATAKLEGSLAAASELNGDYAMLAMYREKVAAREAIAEKAEKSQQMLLIIGAAVFIAGAVLFGTGRKPSTT